MKQREVIVLLGLSFLLAGTARSALACCAQLLPPRKALKQANAVFSGTVLRIKEHNGDHTVLIGVERTWKGIDSRQVLVSTPAGSSIGIRFVAGKKYLIYANQRPGMAGLATDICRGTKLLSQAREDLSQIGSGRVVQGK